MAWVSHWVMGGHGSVPPRRTRQRGLGAKPWAVEWRLPRSPLALRTWLDKILVEPLLMFCMLWWRPVDRLAQVLNGGGTRAWTGLRLAGRNLVMEPLLVLVIVLGVSSWAGIQ